MDVCRAPSKASPKLCSAWLSSVNWPDLDVREGRHARDDRWSVTLGTPHGWSCLDRAQTSCSARSSHARLAQHDAPRVMCSAFEGECGTLFDVQTSLTVVYDAPKPPHDTRRGYDLTLDRFFPFRYYCWPTAGGVRTPGVGPQSKVLEQVLAHILVSYL